MEPCTLGWRITCFPLHTYLNYLVPGMQTSRTTCVLHSLRWLQSCCCRSHNTWRWLCISSADSHIIPLRKCYTSDASLALCRFSSAILSHSAIQSSLRIPLLPLHLLRPYSILQVSNIQSNLQTLYYYSLSLPHSALIHHQLAMCLPPHPQQHHRDHCPHTHRHY